MDLYLARALEHRAPAGSRCLEAGEDNGVLAVGRERLEVMKHTSAGRHATRRNDDLGVRARADRLRLLVLARIGSDIARSTADFGRQPMIGEVFAQTVGSFEDRKGVVKGTSVSVSLNSVVRRIRKKK